MELLDLILPILREDYNYIIERAKISQRQNGVLSITEKNGKTTQASKEMLFKFKQQ